jgi:hypothetical protein
VQEVTEIPGPAPRAGQAVGRTLVAPGGTHARRALARLLPPKPSEAYRSTVSAWKEAVVNVIGTTLANRALALLGAAAPACAVLIPSSPMMKLRAPSYAELYVAYRYRGALWGAGAGAVLTLAARAVRGEASPSVSGGAAAALLGIAAATRVIHAPGMFYRRRTPLRVLEPHEAERVFDDYDTEVVGVRHNGEARAYPVVELTRPHVVYDRLGGDRIAVTYCGLTNSAIAYLADDRVDPEFTVLAAPNNNVVFWEHGTGSLVQQFRRRIVHGPAAGRPLRTLPVAYTTWDAWSRLVPESTIAHAAYDSVHDQLLSKVMRHGQMFTRLSAKPFMAVDGPIDRTLHPKARVFALREGGEAKAYGRSVLARERAINDRAADRPIAVLYDAATDIAMAFRRELDGRELQLHASRDGEFEDRRTGERWDVLGRAVSGSGAERDLVMLPFFFDKPFWFAWKHFHPGVRLARSEGDREEPISPRLVPAGSQIPWPAVSFQTSARSGAPRVAG